MADDNRKAPVTNSPIVLVPILIAIAAAFSTIIWFSARREAAALYGMLRSVELPFLHRYLPYAEHFTMDRLKTGVVPAFSMIYYNSLVYGLIFSALIMLLMMFALMRLEKFSIKDQVTIKSDFGRDPSEIMKKIAVDEASVRFFFDYEVLDLPTTEGTARQPLKALDLLLYTDSLRGVTVDPSNMVPPALNVDDKKLIEWFHARFGPQNPFMAGGSKRRLIDLLEIEREVDDLSWYSVLILYPAMLRLHSFYVEDKDGYEASQDEVDAFIESIWAELNTFKREFGAAIQIGYASDADREERNALYHAKLSQKASKPKKKPIFALKKKAQPEDTGPGFEGSVLLENMTEMARSYRRGKIERGEIPSDGIVVRERAGSRPRDKKDKATKPENLLFFGEVLSERGPNLKVVAAARAGLKDILTRHLGSQRGRYPVGLDAKKRVRYEPKINTPEEKAFNTKAQERLATAQVHIEAVLFRHQYEFSLVGGALERTRKYGIMPPNLFRWLRFCDETTPFWWFVQNLGMPASYPENAGLFEHYQAEKMIGVAIERPHIQTAVKAVREEAERYLVPECIDELQAILGRDAILRQVTQTGFSVNARGRGRKSGDDEMSGFDSFVDRVLKGDAPEKAGSAAGRKAATNSSNRAMLRGQAGQQGRSDGPVAAASAEAPAKQIGVLDGFDLDDDED